MQRAMGSTQQPPAVAGVPPATLADGRATAKAWLLALVVEAPLDAVGALPAGRLAQEGPELCAAVLEAVGADGALARLEPGGDRERLAAKAGALAGARHPTAAVAAVGLLRAVAWRQLRDALGPLDGQATAALAERLAVVCERVAAAAVDPAPGARTPCLVAVPEPGDRPWVRAAARIAARPGDSTAAFALLVLEADAGASLIPAEAAVREALPSAHTLIHEAPDRVWVLAPGAHRSTALALGERLASAAVAAAGAAGDALSLRVAVAACPEDGTDPRALADRAAEGVRAARRLA